jgi:glucosamine-6-phosphate deaminase
MVLNDLYTFMEAKHMKIHVLSDAAELGHAAAAQAAAILIKVIQEKGTARLVLSTGMSQFETLDALIKQPVDWTQVELFHLDEYIGLPVTHPASFRKYLLDRFISHIHLKSVNLVNGEDENQQNSKQLSFLISESPIDLGLIGIGENAHIAFNDPPADFTTTEPYIVVKLSDDCKRQQVREGWFPDLACVPDKAISMSVKQILKCEKIISCVPHAAKAKAIWLTLTSPVSNMIPASILRTHHVVDLYLDHESAARLDEKLISGLERQNSGG